MYINELIPEKLFKYQTFDDKQRYRDFFGKREIFFSAPKRFNDPFDCKIYPFYELGSKKQILDKFVKLKAHQFPNSTRAWREQEALKAYNKNSAIFKNPRLYREQLDLAINSIGVYCLTENNYNILMWSHYAQSHTGFCVEFDAQLVAKITANYIKIKEIIALQRVTYAQKYPTIDPYKISDPKKYLEVLITKSDIWSYEKE